MKTMHKTFAVAALALMASFAAQAQTKPTQTTGEMSPAQKAEEGMVKATKPAPSTVDRKALQAEAKAANKAGASNAGECGPEQKADAGACKKEPVQSTKTRAEVKKDAVAATKTGATTSGEMSPQQKADEGPKKK